uniref:Rho-related GTP-binding protein Rho6-like n=1 Tax=Sinocyclocheilus anshuiensis TaxID=1608454 RepID=A0A671KDQ4_9TELE
MKERRISQPLVMRCKLVLVGDVQCGKTAMLQVLAKDCYPETYVPTVFENYTAGLELEEQRVELSLWDTSGERETDRLTAGHFTYMTALSWKAEIMDFCPSTRIILVGCKTDLRTDVCTLMELSNQRLTPISHEQGTLLAKQVGAEVYLECSAFTSEKSIHSVFRSAALTCLNKLQPPIKQSPTRRLSKRLLHLPSKAELLTSSFSKERTKSCSIM